MRETQSMKDGSSSVGSERSAPDKALLRRLALVAVLAVIGLSLLIVFLALGGKPWWLGDFVIGYSLAGIAALSLTGKRSEPGQG
jgi:hypothetical protein